MFLPEIGKLAGLPADSDRTSWTQWSVGMASPPFLYHPARSPLPHSLSSWISIFVFISLRSRFDNDIFHYSFVMTHSLVLSLRRLFVSACTTFLHHFRRCSRQICRFTLGVLIVPFPSLLVLSDRSFVHYVTGNCGTTISIALLNTPRRLPPRG